MKAIDFHKIYDGFGWELPFEKSKFPLHFYPESGEIFDRIGTYIGDGKIVDNKLILKP